MLIAVHCEDETTIRNNLAQYKNMEKTYRISPSLNRSEEACYISKKQWLLPKKQVLDCIFHLLRQRNGIVYQ
jgi:hypothetical protein